MNRKSLNKGDSITKKPKLSIKNQATNLLQKKSIDVETISDTNEIMKSTASKKNFNTINHKENDTLNKSNGNINIITGFALSKSTSDLNDLNYIKNYYKLLYLYKPKQEYTINYNKAISQ